MAKSLSAPERARLDPAAGARNPPDSAEDMLGMQAVQRTAKPDKTVAWWLFGALFGLIAIAAYFFSKAP